MLLKSSAVEGIGEEKLNLCQVQVLLEMFYLNGFVAKQVDDQRNNYVSFDLSTSQN